MDTISKIMTPHPATCLPETPLEQVARLMIDNDCGQIPVVNHQHEPIGVVTDRDIATRVVAASMDYSKAQAKDAMSSPAKTVQQACSLQECMSLMEQSQVRRVPVVDEKGVLAGIVSLADVAIACEDSEVADVVKKVSVPSP